MGKIADPYKIYNSKKFKKDRDLLQGKNEGELERYVLSIIQGKK